MSIFLTKYKNDVLALFIIGTVMCTILEYITSYIMEKAYNLRWWDYSQKKYNINGRVCLDNSILFGLGGILIVEFINPLLQKLLLKIPNTLTIIITIILFIIFMVDLIISIWITSKIGININKYKNTDATLVIKTEVFKLIENHKYLVPRLLDAYPNLKTLHKQEFKKIKDLIGSSKEEKLKIKEEIKELKDNYKKSLQELKNTKKANEKVIKEEKHNNK